MHSDIEYTYVSHHQLSISHNVPCWGTCKLGLSIHMQLHHAAIVVIHLVLLDSEVTIYWYPLFVTLPVCNYIMYINYNFDGDSLIYIVNASDTAPPNRFKFIQRSTI